MRSAVIGLSFGDEGKGMVTSTLALRSDDSLVVRYSGGHQAGHTVVDDKLGLEHTFANFGSGSLHGYPTYWTKHCTFDPIGFMNEYDVLKEKVDKIKIYIHEDCPVTTPYDRLYNQKFCNDGTCGVGFGSTLEREENHYHFRFSDLFNHTVLLIKKQLISDYYISLDSAKVKDLMVHFDTAVGELYELLDDGTIEIVDDTGVPSFSHTIYEGSQGLLLDQDIGFFPHVTRSNVGRKRLDNFIYHYDEVWYVTRAYQTRHGKGPMSNSKMPLKLIGTEAETNVHNEWQGDFRRSVLDVDLLRYALEQDRKGARNVQEENLVITCLDQMGEWKFTEGRSPFTFKNESKFVENLIEALGFKGNVYLSRSPKSELEQWEGGKQ